MSNLQTVLIGDAEARVCLCATPQLNQYLVATDEGYKSRRQAIEQFNRVAREAPSLRTGAVQIPVVTHVVYNTEKQNVSEEQIDSQIRVLNEDFNAKNADLTKLPKVFKDLVGNANITFFRATRDPRGKPTTGITRTKTTIEAFDASDKLDRRMKFTSDGGIDAWKTDRYLNIWVCPLGPRLLGYAQFPGGPPKEDGVVLNYTCFGVGGTAIPPFDLGRTATHEVGHWLDVFHIWGDDGTACSGTDHCNDTPNQSGCNLGVPTFPRISCGNGPNGDLFQNYMDYTNDAEMFMFTKEQVTRMDAALTGPRASLVGSDFFEFVLQTGTTLPETDDTYKFLLADWNKDGQPDLVAIKNSGSETVGAAVQILSGASTFQEALFDKSTGFKAASAASFDYALADWNGDGHLDLFVIQKDQTGSKKTELTILSGSSQFQEPILEKKPTSLPETNDTYDFALGDWNGDGKPDLFSIKMSKSGKSKAEVQVLSGASDFQKAILDPTSTATLNSADGTFEFLVTDWNGDKKLDLVAVKKSRTSKKPTEVHVLSGSSGFKDLILKTETALHSTEKNFEFAVADWTRDGRPDLVAIKKRDTTTKKTEVHIMAG